MPILTGQAVDLIVGKGQVDFAGVYRICVKIGIAILLTMVAQWVMNVANNKITYSVVRDIRTDAFEKIQVLPLSYIDSHSYGGIVSRVIADADQFADGLLMGFTQLFTGVITILGTLGFMLSVSPVIRNRISAHGYIVKFSFWNIALLHKLCCNFLYWLTVKYIRIIVYSLYVFSAKIICDFPPMLFSVSSYILNQATGKK